MVETTAWNDLFLWSPGRVMSGNSSSQLDRHNWVDLDVPTLRDRIAKEKILLFGTRSALFSVAPGKSKVCQQGPPVEVHHEAEARPKLLISLQPLLRRLPLPGLLSCLEWRHTEFEGEETWNFVQKRQHFCPLFSGLLLSLFWTCKSG